MKKIAVAQFDALEDRAPRYALVGEVDLVVVRFDGQVAVFHGRCLHRGALMADGFVRGNNAAEEFLRRFGRVDAGDGACLWSRPPVEVLAGRSDHLEESDGGNLGR